MKTFFHAVLALTAAGVVASASSVNAAGIVVNSLNQIDYTNGEQLATYDDSTKTYTTTSQLAVGDHLYGISAATVEIPGGTANGTTAFDIVIAKIIDPLSGNSITDPAAYTGQVELLFTSDNTTGGFLTGTGTYTLADGSSVSGLGAVVNTMDALYQGSSLTPGTIGAGNQGDGIAAATDGSLFGNFGLGTTLTSGSANSSWGAPGTGYWASDVTLANGAVTSPSNPYNIGLNDLSPLPPGVGGFNGLTNVNLSLSQGGEASGTDGTSIHNNNVGGSTTFTLVGGGHAFSQLPNGHWATTSADPLSIYPTPEPGTLLMLGSGLAVGLPWLRRRRKAMA